MWPCRVGDHERRFARQCHCLRCYAAGPEDGHFPVPHFGARPPLRVIEVRNADFLRIADVHGRAMDAGKARSRLHCAHYLGMVNRAHTDDERT